LMSKNFYWPDAVPVEPGTGLYGYKPPDGATVDMAPASIEVIFEQKYLPKALCQEQRRSVLKGAFELRQGQGGAGYILSDCVVREVMCILNAIGIHVTFVQGAEFDGVGAIRVVQGAIVDVPSGDGDMFAYFMGSIHCTGCFMMPAGTRGGKGGILKFDAKHKAQAMAALWELDLVKVERAFLGCEIATLAIALLGPHDYNITKNVDGSYCNVTGIRYTGMCKAITEWKRLKVLDVFLKEPIPPPRVLVEQPL